MGQKVNPNGFRIGAGFKDEGSVFYAEKDYAKKLLEDLKMRKLIAVSCKAAQLGRVRLLRSGDGLVVTMYARKPGVVVGKSGADIEKLKKSLSGICGVNVSINVYEIEKPAADALCVASTIASQLEKRGSSKKAMKLAIQNALKAGACGITVSCSGRLGGAEIAKSERYREGVVRLHTFRSNVDYARVAAHTTYGVIGVKVWVAN